MGAVAGRVLLIFKGPYDPNEHYVPLDTSYYNGSTYVCIEETTGNLPTNTTYWQILAEGAATTSAGAFFGACDSLGNVSNKTVTIPNVDNFVLRKGVIVGVAFTNTNTYSATAGNPVSLNVNNSGSYPIYFDGSSNPLGDNKVAFGEADYVNYYQFDGSNWVFIGRSGVQTAEQTPYNNTESGLTAEETQGAIDELAEKLVTTSETVTGNPLSLTTDSAQPAQNTLITFEPIQSGSGDSSPNNVRAISGYDEIDLAVPRKNLWNGKISLSSGYLDENGNFISDNNTYEVTDYICVKASSTITLSHSSSYVVGTPSICWYDENKNVISGIQWNAQASQTITLPSNAKYLRTSMRTFWESSLQVEYGSTATTYEPYDPLTDISEDLDETRYGFTFDVESGELTIYKGFKTYNGSENWEQSANPNACRIPVPSDMDTDNPDAICDTYTYTTTPNDVNYGFAIGSYIAVKDVTNCSTVANFKTYLSGHNITFVYKLKNPITYHLTPHQVRLLEGANVVTTNGTSIGLVYKTGVGATLADLDGLAESINNIQTFSDENLVDKTDIAYVEKGTNASRPYRVGELVYVGGTLYRVATPISSGSAFTVGTNISATTISQRVPKMASALFTSSDYTATSDFDLPTGLYAFRVNLTSLQALGISGVDKIISVIPTNNGGSKYVYCNVQRATQNLVVIINQSSIPTSLFLTIWYID